MTAGFGTSPVSSGLKELRLCGLSTKVLRDDLVTANTEMTWEHRDDMGS